MADEQEQKEKSYILFPNVLSTGQLFGINRENLIAAAAATFIVVSIINRIPFVQDIKTLLTFVCGLTVFYLNVVGIKGRSIPRIILAEIKYRKTCRKDHLRSINYDRKNKAQKNKVEYEGRTDLEKAIFAIKYHYNRLNEKYGK